MKNFLKTTARLGAIALALISAQWSYADHTRIDQALAEEIQQATPQQLLPVVILLKTQPDVRAMLAARAPGMVKATNAVRADLIRELKTTLSQEQARLLQTCQTLTTQGATQDVYGFWLTNAISLKATPAAIQQLAGHPDVDVILDDREQKMIPDDDVLFGAAADLGAKRLWGLDMIRSPEANQGGATGRGILVSVVDTGIQPDHPAFGEGQLLKEKCASTVDSEPGIEDGNGHGTWCGTKIASVVYGVATEAHLMSVKVLSSSGSGSWTSVAKGWEISVENGAHVISASLGGRASKNGNVVEEMVRNAHEMGIISVIAAGNSGPRRSTIGTPGVVLESITVGAVNRQNQIADFSSRGPSVYGDAKPDLTAPGVKSTSGWIGGSEKAISGTSMATPHVAGLVALYLAAFPNATPEQVKTTLMSTTQGPEKKNVFGKGTIDCVKALKPKG